MLCAKYALNHTREARARARTRARSASFPPIQVVRARLTRVSFARVLARGARLQANKQSFAKHKARAPKRVSASAHVGSARDRCLIYVCDRRRRPRRAAGRVCTRL